MTKVLVIIPTYNEKENIEAIIEAVFALPKAFSILVVDDGSPDGTASIVKDLQKKYPETLFIVERSGKLGLGTAYIKGFRWGLEHGFDLFCEMDADFSHNPNDLIRLAEACESGVADMSIGSRYVKGGNVKDWPFDRIFLSYGASIYVRMITWMPIMDPTAGFVCYTRKVLESIDLDKIRFTGYAFQIEMKYAAYSLGYQLKEIPITFKDRELGTSKMSSSIIGEAATGVLKMRLKNIFKNYGFENMKEKLSDSTK